MPRGCGKTTIVILSRSVAKAKNPCFVRLRPFACAQGDNHVSRRRLLQHPAFGRGSGRAHVIRELVDEIMASRRYAAMLSTGLDPFSVSRFEHITQRLTVPTYFMQSLVVIPDWGQEHPDKQAAQWVQEFAVDAMMLWQTSGLPTQIPDRLRGQASKPLTQYRQQISSDMSTENRCTSDPN